MSDMGPIPEQSVDTSSARQNRCRDWAFTGIAAAAGFLAFIPTLWYGFVWDDQYGIVHNQALRSWKTLGSVFWGPWDPSVTMFRPVTSALVFLQFQVFGLHPWGYHLTSIVLHAAATAMVYRFSLELGAGRQAALCASLLFAVHAVHLEAIAWISTLADPLVTSIILAALIAFLRYRRTGNGGRLCVLCAWLFVGLLTKETAAVVPFFLLVLEFTVLVKERLTLKIAATTFFSVAATGLLYLGIRVSAYPGVLYNETSLPLSTLLLTWPSLFVFYLKHLLIPAPLSPFYESNYVTSAGQAFWIPCLILLVFSAIAYYWTKRASNRHIAALCFVAMPIGLLPVLNLNIFQWRELAHDRFLYLPSIFFVLLLGTLFFGDGKGAPIEPVRAGLNRRLSTVLAATLGILYLGLLWIQSPPWKNDLTLFSYAARISPGNVRPVFSLALLRLERGELPEAERLLQHVVGIAPAPRALGLLGETRIRMGKMEAAEEPLRRAIAAAPNRPGLHAALATCLRAQGRTREAEAELTTESAIVQSLRQPAGNAPAR